MSGQKKSVFCRGMSAFVALCMLLWQFSGTPLHAQSAFLNPSAAAPDLFPLKVDDIRVPEKLGKIEETHQAENGLVILVQDAHAIPQAQFNIRNLIDFFQTKYGLSTVALEGSMTDLDPQIFRSFPDKKILKQVFREYLENGELTGTTMAAIFNEKEARYEGIEDWDLYAEGYGYYLEALKRKPETSSRLKQLNETLTKEKERIYPERLLKIDRALQKFHSNSLELLKMLETLNEVKAPPAGSEIEIILEENSRGEESLIPVELEVKSIAEKAEAFFRRNPSVGNHSLVVEFHAQRQAFNISQISAEQFAVFLKDLCLQMNLPFHFSEGLAGRVKKQRKLQDIEGTRFFDQFESYADEVKSELIETEAVRELDNRSHRIYLLERLSDMELSRDQWHQVKSYAYRGRFMGPNNIYLKREHIERLIPEKDLRDLFMPHLLFYENAEKRDAVFVKKLGKLREAVGGGRKTVLVVAGGFHTEGLIERFKKENTSYLLLTPRILQLPDTIYYREHMRGNVSWKDYFEIEDGKINQYKAFVRATRDRLLDEAGKADSLRDALRAAGLLKEWRDQIVRDLAEEGRVAESGRYTRFMDETVDGGDGASAEDVLLKKIDSFVSGLRELQARGELSQQNIANLLRPSAMADATYNVLGNIALALPGVSAPLAGDVQRSDLRAETEEELANDEEGFDWDNWEVVFDGPAMDPNPPSLQEQRDMLHAAALGAQDMLAHGVANPITNKEGRQSEDPLRTVRSILSSGQLIHYALRETYQQLTASTQGQSPYDNGTGLFIVRPGYEMAIKRKVDLETGDVTQTTRSLESILLIVVDIKHLYDLRQEFPQYVSTVPQPGVPRIVSYEEAAEILAREYPREDIPFAETVETGAEDFNLLIEGLVRGENPETLSLQYGFPVSVFQSGMFADTFLSEAVIDGLARDIVIKIQGGFGNDGADESTLEHLVAERNFLRDAEKDEVPGLARIYHESFNEAGELTGLVKGFIPGEPMTYADVADPEQAAVYRNKVKSILKGAADIRTENAPQGYELTDFNIANLIVDEAGDIAITDGGSFEAIQGTPKNSIERQLDRLFEKPQGIIGTAGPQMSTSPVVQRSDLRSNDENTLTPVRELAKRVNEAVKTGDLAAVEGVLATLDRERASNPEGLKNIKNNILVYVQGKPGAFQSAEAKEFLESLREVEASDPWEFLAAFESLLAKSRERLAALGITFRAGDLEGEVDSVWNTRLALLAENAVNEGTAEYTAAPDLGRLNSNTLFASVKKSGRFFTFEKAEEINGFNRIMLIAGLNSRDSLLSLSNLNDEYRMLVPKRSDLRDIEALTDQVVELSKTVSYEDIRARLMDEKPLINEIIERFDEVVRLLQKRHQSTDSAEERALYEEIAQSIVSMMADGLSMMVHEVETANAKSNAWQYERLGNASKKSLKSKFEYVKDIYTRMRVLFETNSVAEDGFVNPGNFGGIAYLMKDASEKAAQLQQEVENAGQRINPLPKPAFLRMFLASVVHWLRRLFNGAYTLKEDSTILKSGDSFKIGSALFQVQQINAQNNTIRILRMNGDKRGETINVSRWVRFGRHPDADVIIDEAPVSREHAVIYDSGQGNWFITDASSSGTVLYSPANKIRREATARSDLRSNEEEAGTSFVEGLFEQGTVRTFHPGEVVVRQGEAGTSIFLLLSGRVDVHAESVKDAQSGKVSSIDGTMEDYVVFGEMAYFNDGLRTATIRASTEIEVLEITFDQLKSLDATGEWVDYLMSLTAYRSQNTQQFFENGEAGRDSLKITTTFKNPFEILDRLMSQMSDEQKNDQAGISRSFQALESARRNYMKLMLEKTELSKTFSGGTPSAFDYVRHPRATARYNEMKKEMETLLAEINLLKSEYEEQIKKAPELDANLALDLAAAEAYLAAYPENAPLLLDFNLVDPKTEEIFPFYVTYSNGESGSIVIDIHSRSPGGNASLKLDYFPSTGSLMFSNQMTRLSGNLAGRGFYSQILYGLTRAEEVHYIHTTVANSETRGVIDAYYENNKDLDESGDYLPVPQSVLQAFTPLGASRKGAGFIYDTVYNYAAYPELLNFRILDPDQPVDDQPAFLVNLNRLLTQATAIERAGIEALESGTDDFEVIAAAAAELGERFDANIEEIREAMGNEELWPFEENHRNLRSAVLRQAVSQRARLEEIEFAEDSAGVFEIYRSVARSDLRKADGNEQLIGDVNQARPEVPASMMPTVEKTAAAAIKAAEHIAGIIEANANKPVRIMVSGRSGFISKSLIETAWAGRYPGKDPLRIDEIDKDLNFALRSDAEPLAAVESRLRETLGLSETGWNALKTEPVIFLDDFMDRGVKYRALKERFASAGFEKMNFTYIGSREETRFSDADLFIGAKDSGVKGLLSNLAAQTGAPERSPFVEAYLDAVRKSISERAVRSDLRSEGETLADILLEAEAKNPGNLFSVLNSEKRDVLYQPFKTFMDAVGVLKERYEAAASEEDKARYKKAASQVVGTLGADLNAQVQNFLSGAPELEAWRYEDAAAEMESLAARHEALAQFVSANPNAGKFLYMDLFSGNESYLKMAKNKMAEIQESYAFSPNYVESAGPFSATRRLLMNIKYMLNVLFRTPDLVHKGKNRVIRAGDYFQVGEDLFYFDSIAPDGKSSLVIRANGPESGHVFKVSRWAYFGAGSPESDILTHDKSVAWRQAAIHGDRRGWYINSLVDNGVIFYSGYNPLRVVGARSDLRDSLLPSEGKEVRIEFDPSALINDLQYEWQSISPSEQQVLKLLIGTIELRLRVPPDQLDDLASVEAEFSRSRSYQILKDLFRPVPTEEEVEGAPRSRLLQILYRQGFSQKDVESFYLRYYVSDIRLSYLGEGDHRLVDLIEARQGEDVREVMTASLYHEYEDAEVGLARTEQQELSRIYTDDTFLPVRSHFQIPFGLSVSAEDERIIAYKSYAQGLSVANLIQGLYSSADFQRQDRIAKFLTESFSLMGRLMGDVFRVTDGGLIQDAHLGNFVIDFDVIAGDGLTAAGVTNVDLERGITEPLSQNQYRAGLIASLDHLRRLLRDSDPAKAGQSFFELSRAYLLAYYTAREADVIPGRDIRTIVEEELRVIFPDGWKGLPLYTDIMGTVEVIENRIEQIRNTSRSDLRSGQTTLADAVELIKNFSGDPKTVAAIAALSSAHDSGVIERLARTYADSRTDADFVRLIISLNKISDYSEAVPALILGLPDRSAVTDVLKDVLDSGVTNQKFMDVQNIPQVFITAAGILGSIGDERAKDALINAQENFGQSFRAIDKTLGYSFLSKAIYDAFSRRLLDMLHSHIRQAQSLEGEVIDINELAFLSEGERREIESFLKSLQNYKDNPSEVSLHWLNMDARALEEALGGYSIHVSFRESDGPGLKTLNPIIGPVILKNNHLPPVPDGFEFNAKHVQNEEKASSLSEQGGRLEGYQFAYKEPIVVRDKNFDRQLVEELQDIQRRRLREGSDSITYYEALTLQGYARYLSDPELLAEKHYEDVEIHEVRHYMNKAVDLIPLQGGSYYNYFSGQMSNLLLVPYAAAHNWNGGQKYTFERGVAEEITAFYAQLALSPISPAALGDLFERVQRLLTRLNGAGIQTLQQVNDNYNKKAVMQMDVYEFAAVEILDNLFQHLAGRDSRLQASIYDMNADSLRIAGKIILSHMQNFESGYFDEDELAYFAEKNFQKKTGSSLYKGNYQDGREQETKVSTEYFHAANLIEGLREYSARDSAELRETIISSRDFFKRSNYVYRDMKPSEKVSPGDILKSGDLELVIESVNDDSVSYVIVPEDSDLKAGENYFRMMNAEEFQGAIDSGEAQRLVNASRSDLRAPDFLGAPEGPAARKAYKKRVAELQARFSSETWNATRAYEMIFGEKKRAVEFLAEQAGITTTKERVYLSTLLDRWIHDPVEIDFMEAMFKRGNEARETVADVLNSGAFYLKSDKEDTQKENAFMAGLTQNPEMSTEYLFYHISGADSDVTEEARVTAKVMNTMLSRSDGTIIERLRELDERIADITKWDFVNRFPGASEVTLSRGIGIDHGYKLGEQEIPKPVFFTHVPDYAQTFAYYQTVIAKVPLESLRRTSWSFNPDGEDVRSVEPEVLVRGSVDMLFVFPSDELDAVVEWVEAIRPLNDYLETNKDSFRVSDFGDVDQETRSKAFQSAAYREFEGLFGNAKKFNLSSGEHIKRVIRSVTKIAEGYLAEHNNNYREAAQALRDFFDDPNGLSGLSDRADIVKALEAEAARVSVRSDLRNSEFETFLRGEMPYLFEGASPSVAYLDFGSYEGDFIAAMTGYFEDGGVSVDLGLGVELADTTYKFSQEYRTDAVTAVRADATSPQKVIEAYNNYERKNPDFNLGEETVDIVFMNAPDLQKMDKEIIREWFRSALSFLKPGGRVFLRLYDYPESRFTDPASIERNKKRERELLFETLDQLGDELAYIEIPASQAPDFPMGSHKLEQTLFVLSPVTQAAGVASGRSDLRVDDPGLITSIPELAEEAASGVKAALNGETVDVNTVASTVYQGSLLDFDAFLDAFVERVRAQAQGKGSGEYIDQIVETMQAVAAHIKSQYSQAKGTFILSPTGDRSKLGPSSSRAYHDAISRAVEFIEAPLYYHGFVDNEMLKDALKNAGVASFQPVSNLSAVRRTGRAPFASLLKGDTEHRDTGSGADMMQIGLLRPERYENIDAQQYEEAYAVFMQFVFGYVAMQELNESEFRFIKGLNDFAAAQDPTLSEQAILQLYASEVSGRDIAALKKQIQDIKDKLARPLEAVLGDAAGGLMNGLGKGTLNVMMSQIKASIEAHQAVKQSA